MSGTPLRWRIGLFAVAFALAVAAYLFADTLGSRGRAAVGIATFIAVVAGCSANLRAVSPRTFAAGFVLQLVLAVAVLHSEWVRGGFEIVGSGIKKLLGYSTEGGKFVFGPLATPSPTPVDSLGAIAGAPAFRGQSEAVAGRPWSYGAPFIFATVALPPIIFVSGFFSLLYYFGVLQLLVKALSRVMVVLMRTSGAETLSVSANVFMGQTEAPLIVKPFVPRMTQSELLAMMASGMAHISGGMMAVYIGYGADPVAILTTCVMACPCSLYLSKLLLPETESPETLGSVKVDVPRTHANPIDALAGGIKDGLQLALNVAAMLIGFLAMVALVNGLIGGIKPGLLWLGLSPESLTWWPDSLTLQEILGWIFRPAALLIGVDPADTGKVGSLLGIKLVANEHVAFVELTKHHPPDWIAERSRILTVFALSGFANFASVGIQLGGIGALAPERRSDLARLGMRALFVGFMTTLVNAAVAGLLM